MEKACKFITIFISVSVFFLNYPTVPNKNTKIIRHNFMIYKKSLTSRYSPTHSIYIFQEAALPIHEHLEQNLIRPTNPTGKRRHPEFINKSGRLACFLVIEIIYRTQQ